MLGQEPRRGVRDLLGPGEASERDRREHARLRLGVGEDVRLRAVGGHEPGRERVDADPERSPLARERLREGDEPRLRRGGVRDLRRTGPSVGRDDVDDRTAAAYGRLPSEGL